jgi:ADP-ribosylglycohydrolase
MYGAILGDIIGSPFEFDGGNKSKWRTNDIS